MNLIVNGQAFDRSISHFSFDSLHIGRMEELAKLSGFASLRSASFCDTNLNDDGLRHLANATTIENLNLQYTQISNQGLAFLAGMPRLTDLRLKGNDQLTSDCIVHLLKLGNLENLQIHETSIDQSGLDRLAPMAQLRDLCIDEWNEHLSFESLQALSRQMPLCLILVKGKGQFCDGVFSGKW